MSLVMFSDEGSVSYDFRFEFIRKKVIDYIPCFLDKCVVRLMNDMGATGRVELKKEVLPRAHDIG